MLASSVVVLGVPSLLELAVLKLDWLVIFIEDCSFDFIVSEWIGFLLADWFKVFKPLPFILNLFWNLLFGFLIMTRLDAASFFFGSFYRCFISSVTSLIDLMIVENRYFELIIPYQALLAIERWRKVSSWITIDICRNLPSDNLSSSVRSK